MLETGDGDPDTRTGLFFDAVESAAGRQGFCGARAGWPCTAAELYRAVRVRLAARAILERPWDNDWLEDAPSEDLSRLVVGLAARWIAARIDEAAAGIDLDTDNLVTDLDDLVWTATPEGDWSVLEPVPDPVARLLGCFGMSRARLDEQAGRYAALVVRDNSKHVPEPEDDEEEP